MAKSKYVKDIDRGWLGIKENLRRGDGVEIAVGVHEGAKNGEGLTIAEYATYNEFGATINVQAHTQTIYRRLTKKGDFYRGSSKFVKREKSNYAKETNVAAHTITLPERPFMRTSFDENKSKYSRQMERIWKTITSKNGNVGQALAPLGLMATQDIKRTISGRDFLPKLSDRTIKAKKGSTKTLIDTGAMINSIHHVIRRVK